MVWKLERKNSERRVHGLKCTGGETVRNFLAKLHSNYFRAVLLDGASFGTNRSNAYEFAHDAMVNQGPPFPPPDKMKRLICLIVHSGLLRFVQFQISSLSPPDMNYHLLYASVHRDMVWLEFLEELAKKCGELGWFENDRRTLRERLMAARVSHGRVESNSSRK